MGKRIPTKRDFSRAGRRDQLDGSRRPRRVLWLYCKHHQGGYYFHNVHKNTWNINEADKWNDEPDMRKMEGLCMSCNCTTIFFVSADELTEQRYTDVELCLCGLPAWHQNPSPEFIAQYNARPVPHRTLPNA